MPLSAMDSEIFRLFFAELRSTHAAELEAFMRQIPEDQLSGEEWGRLEHERGSRMEKVCIQITEKLGLACEKEEVASLPLAVLRAMRDPEFDYLQHRADMEELYAIFRFRLGMHKEES